MARVKEKTKPNRMFYPSKGVQRTCLMLALLYSQIGSSSDMRYFHDHIDYWKSQEQETKPQKESPKAIEPPISDNLSKKETPSETKDQGFQWNKFLDPKNKEFFKEGDYTPPEPFMELVRDPSDKNIKMWFSYMEKKNALAEQLARRMEEYTEKNQTALPREAKVKITAAAKNIPLADDEFERYRFRMYFDSQCPHCQHMMSTLNDLQDRGYFVEAKQVDSGSIAKMNAHVTITPASPEELKKFRITSVPLLLMGDLRAKKVYRQSGYMTPEEVLAQVRGR